MIGSWSNRIIDESRCYIRDRHALDTPSPDVNYTALPLARPAAPARRAITSPAASPRAPHLRAELPLPHPRDDLPEAGQVLGGHAGGPHDGVPPVDILGRVPVAMAVRNAGGERKVGGDLP